MDNGEFGDSLVKMLAWWRKQLPELGTPQGVELMRRLLKHAGRPQPIGTIYSASKLSTPTMRVAVKAFVKHGFACIQFHSIDGRSRLIMATPKLTAFAKEYLRRIIELR